MTYVAGLVALLVTLAGVIAYAGDRLGTWVGRRRLTLFGARPRRTGQIVGVAAGILIMLTTLGVLSIAFRSATQTLLNAQRTAQQLQALQGQERELQVQLQGMLSQQVALEADLRIARGIIDEAEAARDAALTDRDRLRAEAVATQLQLAEVFERLAVAQADLDEVVFELEQAQAERSAALAEVADARAEIGALEGEVALAEAALAAADVRLLELDVQLSEADAALATADELRLASEAAASTAMAAAEAADAARLSADAARLSAEAERRVAEEGLTTAEAARNDAETARAVAEADLTAAEAARAVAEAEREVAEAGLADAVAAGEAADAARRDAEAARAEALAARDEAVAARGEAVAARGEAEAARQVAEDARVAADAAREAAVLERVAAQAQVDALVARTDMLVAQVTELEAEADELERTAERLSGEAVVLQQENAGLQARNDQLGSSNEELSGRNVALQELNVSLQGEILAGNEQVRALQDQVRGLSDRLDDQARRLVEVQQEFSRAASGEITFARDQVVYSGALLAKEPAEAREELAAFVRAASDHTARLGAGEVVLSAEQFAGLAEVIADTDGSDLVRLISPRNQFNPARVEVIVEALENTRLYEAGQLLMSRRIHVGTPELPATQDEVRDRIAQFRADVIRGLRRTGLDELQAPIFVGSSDEGFANQLMRLRGSVVIGVVALEAIDRAGPAHVELVIVY